MNKDSRTKNTIRNMLFGTGSQIFMILLNFISRTIFIKILSEEYLGINGLFTNVLTILSLAELGISNAIMFGLYKPLAEGNKKKVTQLMRLFGRFYAYIGIFVLIVGLLAIPFLNYIISDPIDIPYNITFIYLLYLAEIVLSYFYCYKQNILVADQKDYIKTKYKQVFAIITIVLKIIVLYFTKNFIFYLIVQILVPYIGNIMASRKAEKLYPFIKEKQEDLDEKEKKEIFKNVKSLSLYRFSTVILDSTDNIIITKLLGLKITGLASNYLLVLSSIKQLLLQINNSLIASVGNLNAVEDNSKKYETFNKLNFFYFWLYGFFAIMIAVLINPLIDIWIGDKFLLSEYVVIALVFDFYIMGLEKLTFTYRTTMGLFEKYRFTPLLAAFLNIVLSIVLAKLLGLTGIFLATSISRVLTFGIVDPILIYKYGFKKNVKDYYFSFFKYLLFLIIIYFVVYYLISFIPFNNILGFILKGIVGVFIFNILFIIVFCKNKNFIALQDVMKHIFYSIKKKIKKNKD